MAESDLDSELENVDLGDDAEGGGEEMSLDDDLAGLAGGEGEEGGEEVSFDDELAGLTGGEGEAGGGEEMSLDDDLAGLAGGEGEEGSEGESLQFDDDLSQLEESMGVDAPAGASDAGGIARPPAPGEAVNLDFLLDVKLDVTFEVGRAKMVVTDLLTLGQGSVIELHRLVGEELDLLVNGKLIAKGEVVVVNEKFGCKISEIVSPEDRVKYLGGL